jgi:glycine cleavage system H lipoate-binding protein
MGLDATRTSMKIVPPGKKKCVWMEAGVVSFKLCDNNYDCSTCVYDHAMQTKVERQKASAAPGVESPAEGFNETWVERMMQLPASRRKCRYMITGEVSRKICPNAYDCGNCSFDQMMQHRLQSEVLPVRALSTVGDIQVAEEFYYHDGHAWARPEYGGRVRVGLDDFGRRLMGRISKVELPGIGQGLKQGETGFGLTRNGHSARVLSPVDGIVVNFNERLLGQPDLILQSPYEKGWLFIVEPTQLRKNLKGLYYGEEAHKFLSEERDGLIALASDMRIAADGGISVDDIFEELGEKDWLKMVKAFLKT